MHPTEARWRLQVIRCSHKAAVRQLNRLRGVRGAGTFPGLAHTTPTSRVSRTIHLAVTRDAPRHIMTSSAGMPSERLQLLDASWSHAGLLYLQELVPRFLPWTLTGLATLLAAAASQGLPPGRPVLAPCCGPGPELLLLSRALRHRHPLLGVDVSQGMLRLAQCLIDAEAAPPARAAAAAAGGGAAGPPPTSPFSCRQQQCQGGRGQRTLAPTSSQHPTDPLGGRQGGGPGPLLGAGPAPPGLVSVVVGDACLLDHSHQGAAAALFSVFGLQQLGTQAPQALASWARCLAPGGVLLLLLWPPRAEEEGPWAAYEAALAAQRQRHSSAAQPSAPPPPGSPLVPAARPQGSCPPAAAPPLWYQEVLEVASQRVSHMALQVMTNGGPWHARRVVEGDAATDALRDAWLQALRVRQPDITLASPLRHSPAARLLVIR
ncbi:hypothetical protein QJQ45_019514, partial [Haematococcus lacustris]